MKVIDAFLYNGEAKLLHLRRKTLGDCVTEHFLVESDKTFSGLKKDSSLMYQDNSKDWDYSFAGYPRLRYVTPTCPYDDRWENERHVRNFIDAKLIKIDDSYSDDDIVLISDVDEIPDPAYMTLLIDKANTYGSATCYMRNFYYYLNVIQEGGSYLWPGTIAVKLGVLKDTEAEDLRRTREHQSWQKGIVNGWHFSFMGGKETIQKKIASFSHSEYDSDYYKDEKRLEKVLTSHGGKFIDLFDRGNSYTLLHPKDALGLLPKTISSNFGMYKDWFYKEKY